MIKIRNEQPTDYRQVEEVTRKAFWNLGPVSITPELHRQGYGRMLITHAIEAARNQGHRAIVLGGFPYHYEPYGFVSTKRYDISMTDGKFYTGIMALPLYDGALDDITGILKLSNALYPDDSELEPYENTLEPLEKKVLPQQKKFEQAASELDLNDYSK